MINVAAAHGHPASVMDMSFAAQTLATEWSLKMKGKLDHKVYNVPKAVDQWVASLKLQTMGVAIDTLTDEQKKANAQYIPLGRVGTDAEVAHAVAFLASEGAGYITGHTLDVNGGMHMG